jgi:hypothetical protein
MRSNQANSVTADLYLRCQLVHRFDNASYHRPHHPFEQHSELLLSRRVIAEVVRVQPACVCQQRAVLHYCLEQSPDPIQS